jgi:cobalt/nickel transport system permease protein
MLNEPFASGRSLLHRLDPRLRVLAATLLSVIVALSFQFTVLTAALAAALALVIAGRLNAAEVVKRMLIINGFVLLLWVILPLTFPGEVVSAWGPVKIYRPGVELSARITLKSNCIFLLLIALIATMPFATLGHSLHKMGLPDKLVFLLLMSYRYVFVMEQEYHRLIRAAKIRGFQPATNRHTYRTYAYVVGMMFVRAADRAERVYQAMRCRGFKDRFHSLRQFRASMVDAAFAAFSVMLAGGLIYFEWLST